MKTTILEGPDGRLYEIADDRLAEYAVPGERVAELRNRRGNRSGTTEAVAEHLALGQLPLGHPGYEEQQRILAERAKPSTGITLNVYVNTPASGGVPAVSLRINDGAVTGLAGGHDEFAGANLVAAAARADGAEGVEGYHMSFDESGIPVSHTDMLWGDYIDKQGNPAVGFHSHDAVSGNAQ